MGVDGAIASAAFDFILDRLSFVPGTTTVAFGARAGNMWAIYQGSDKVTRDFVGVTAPVFGADGRPVYGAQTDKLWAVYSGSGDKLSPDFDELGARMQTLRRQAPCLQGASEQIVVHLGRPQEGIAVFRWLQDPVFVPGRERVIYSAPASGGTVLMSGNEKLSQAFLAIGQIRVSSDGRYVAYDAEAGAGSARRRHFIMVNGRRQPPTLTGRSTFGSRMAGSSSLLPMTTPSGRSYTRGSAYKG